MIRPQTARSGIILGSHWQRAAVLLTNFNHTEEPKQTHPSDSINLKFFDSNIFSVVDESLLFVVSNLFC